MEQYIKKSALVAEIGWLQATTMDEDGNFYTAKAQAEYNVLCMLESFLDTLETKEVKEPTASDKGMIEEIIVNLKRVEQDYHIDLTREMTWLRSKAQKGE